MSDKVFLKEVPGRLVLDPFTHVRLKPDGEWKPASPHWARKVMHGDCIIEAEAALPLPEETTPAAPTPEPTTPESLVTVPESTTAQEAVSDAAERPRKHQRKGSND